MKIKGQEEEIRRLRESLNSGDPLHLSVAFQHQLQHSISFFISFYCESSILSSILSSDTSLLTQRLYSHLLSGSSDSLLGHFMLFSLTDNRAVYEKLRSVISENKELEKMVSAGRVQQLGMEIGLLKRENEQLKQVIDGFSEGMMRRLI